MRSTKGTRLFLAGLYEDLPSATNQMLACMRVRHMSLMLLTSNTLTMLSIELGCMRIIPQSNACMHAYHEHDAPAVRVFEDFKHQVDANKNFA